MRAVVISRISKECWFQAQDGMGTRAVLAELKRQIDIVYLREDVGNLLTESMEGLLRVKRIIQDLKDFSHVDGSEKQWAYLKHGMDSTLNIIDSGQ